jgi:hypothetical protein
MSACAAGTYAVGGAAACEACPAGTFGPDAGAYALDACVTCPAGTFSNATAATSDATCLACPEDTYCDVAGATAPTACPAGTGTFGATARDNADACARPSPPPPPPSPPPVPSSPPPPPLPPALAAGADATPTMTLRLDGDPAAFDEAAFKTGVAAAAGGGAVAADVVVEAVRSGSVVVDFYVAVPNVLFPVSLGGAWDVQELSRVVETLNAAIAGGTLNVGAPVLSAALEAHCSPGSRVAAEIGAAGTLVCEICGVGTFSATRDAETCAPCAVGYAAGARGMTECEICAPGSVAAAAGNRCLQTVRGGNRRAGGGERFVRGVRRLFLRRRRWLDTVRGVPSRLSVRAERVVVGDGAHARGRRAQRRGARGGGPRRVRGERDEVRVFRGARVGGRRGAGVDARGGGGGDAPRHRRRDVLAGARALVAAAPAGEVRRRRDLLRGDARRVRRRRRGRRGQKTRRTRWIL